MNQCPCGSDQSYSECCEPLIKGTRSAGTAEELMRSRYCAYAKTEIAYLLQTTHPELRKDSDEKSMRNWSRNSEWHKLEVIETNDGGPDDSEGQVEFIAHYSEKGVKKIHHERASFIKEDNTWFFKDAETIKPQQYIRPTPKVGRNEPCPCGSGKKHKKCCGA